MGDLVDVKEEIRTAKFSPHYNCPYEEGEFTEKNNVLLSDAERKRFRKHKVQIKRAHLCFHETA